MFSTYIYAFLVLALGFIDTVVSLPINCLPYKTDKDILSSLGFSILLKPNSFDYNQTSASIDDKNQVTGLAILNETYIPSQLFCLKHLQSLYISNSSFYRSKLNDASMYTIPSEIGQLSSTLNYLGLHNMPISYLPTEFYRLTQLTSLSIHNTGLKALSNDIGHFNSLETLEITNNALTSLPLTLQQCTKLTHVDVANNPIQSLIALEGLQSLVWLSAKDCQLQKIPLNLPSIELLYLMGNNIDSLDGIHTLGSKTTEKINLFFGVNKISKIPSAIGQMKNLADLDLQFNHLQDLPSEIYTLPALDYFFLFGNLFTKGQMEIIKKRFAIENPNVILIA